MENRTPSSKIGNLEAHLELTRELVPTRLFGVSDEIRTRISAVKVQDPYH